MFGAVEKTTAARSFLETTFAGEVQAALRLLYVPVSAAAVVLTQKVIWIRADGSKEATLRLSAHFLCLDLDAEDPNNAESEHIQLPLSVFLQDSLETRDGVVEWNCRNFRQLRVRCENCAVAAAASLFAKLGELTKKYEPSIDILKASVKLNTTATQFMFDAKRVLAAANVDPTKWQIPWNAPYAIYPSGLSESELATLSKTFVGGDLVQFIWSIASCPGSVLMRSSRRFTGTFGEEVGLADAVAAMYLNGPISPGAHDLTLRYTDLLQMCCGNNRLHLIDTGAPSLAIREFMSMLDPRFLGYDTVQIELGFSSLVNAAMSIPEFQEAPRAFLTEKWSSWWNIMTKLFDATRLVVGHLKKGEGVLIQTRNERDIGACLLTLPIVILEPRSRTMVGLIHAVNHHFSVATGCHAPDNFAWPGIHLLLHSLHELRRHNPRAFEYSDEFLIAISEVVAASSLCRHSDSDTLHLTSMEIFARMMNEIRTHPAVRQPLYDPNAKVDLDSLGPPSFFLELYARYNKSVIFAQSELATHFNLAKAFRSTVVEVSKVALTNIYVNEHIASQLNRLEEFVAIGVPIETFDGEALFPFQNLKMVSLERTRLSQVPALLEKIPSLTSLSLAGNQIQDATAEPFSLLTNLKELKLDDNNIGNIHFLATLPSLTVLKIRGNGVTYLPITLTVLTNLSELDVSKNKLSVLSPALMGAMRRLKILKADDNNLVSLPSNMSPLVREIHAQKNALMILPADLGQCRHLMTLRLGHNRLQSLPKSMANLVQLRTLSVEHNAITEIPSWLFCLTQLQNCDLSSNKIPGISASLCQLPSLRVLNVSDNLITALPASLGALMGTLQECDWSKNDIRFPGPDILSKGVKATLTFLSETLHSELPQHRAKILVLGRENVGKTSLIAALSTVAANSSLSTPWQKLASSFPRRTKPTSPGLSTDGIDIQRLSFIPNKEVLKKAKCPNLTKRSSVNVSVWDFAGQEVYYASHQLFLSNAAIYCIMFKLTDEDLRLHIDFWLRSVRSRVKDPKILLVGTHLDACNEKLRASLPALAQQYVGKVSGVAGCYFVSTAAISQENVVSLREALEELIVSDKRLEQKMSFSQVALENLLRERSQGMVVPLLTQKELAQLGSFCQLSFEATMSSAQHLHELGSIVYFGRSSILKDLCVLDPQWLIDVLATVFTTKHRWVKQGILLKNALAQIWKEYPERIHSLLLDLLEKFDIAFVPKLWNQRTSAAFALSSDAPLLANSVVFTALLPSTRPDAVLLKEWYSKPRFAYDKPIQRVYQLGFVPAGLFARALNRVLLIFGDQVLAVWGNGVLARISESVMCLLELTELAELSNLEPPTAMVVTVECEKDSERGHARNLFASILSELDRVLQHYSFLDVQKFVVISESPMEFLPLDSLLPDLQKSLSSPILNKLDSKGNEISLNLHDAVPDLMVSDYNGPRLSLNDISGLAYFAKGGYSHIYRGDHGTDKHPVAVKFALNHTTSHSGSLLLNTPSTALSNSISLHDLRREVALHASLKHPAIIHIEAVIVAPFAPVMEFVAHGTLHSRLHKWDHSLPWSWRLQAAINIAEALAYLHALSPPLAHLDVKSPNILVTTFKTQSEDDVVVKLADFGCATYIHSPITERKVDNPVWLAPEILSRQPYTESVDVYAFGVVLWEILTRQDFFAEVVQMSALTDRVVEGDRPPMPLSTPLPYEALVRGCWAQNPNLRWHWRKSDRTSPSLQRSHTNGDLGDSSPQSLLAAAQGGNGGSILPTLYDLRKVVEGFDAVEKEVDVDLAESKRATGPALSRNLPPPLNKRPPAPSVSSSALKEEHHVALAAKRNSGPTDTRGIRNKSKSKSRLETASYKSILPTSKETVASQPPESSSHPSPTSASSSSHTHSPAAAPATEGEIARLQSLKPSVKHSPPGKRSPKKEKIKVQMAASRTRPRSATVTEETDKLRVLTRTNDEGAELFVSAPPKTPHPLRASAEYTEPKNPKAPKTPPPSSKEKVQSPRSTSEGAKGKDLEQDSLNDKRLQVDADAINIMLPWGHLSHGSHTNFNSEGGSNGNK